MNPWGVGFLLLACLFLSGVFSGSETGVYTISRMRVDADAREGRRSARVLRWLLRNDAGLLITLLIGNNLMLELLTHGFEQHVVPRRLPVWTREIAVTLALTPVVFLFGELLPKDFFRRRPHRLLTAVGPFLVVVRVVMLPISIPLQLLSLGLQRVFGIQEKRATRAFHRQAMLEVLHEGTRAGALSPHAEGLAHNVLVLRETPVSDVMVPWDRVTLVDLDLADDESRAAVVASEFTRVPAVRTARGKVPGESEARRVVGYVHQLDVLGGEGRVAEDLRELPRLDPETPVDRALARLRQSGQRLALVGSRTAPGGLVTLMDLLDAISKESTGRSRPSPAPGVAG